MSKTSRRRISRSILAAVAVALGIGSCYWMYNLGQRSSARAEAARKTPLAAVASASVPGSTSSTPSPTASAQSDVPGAPAPLVMETPSTRPSGESTPLLLSSTVAPAPSAATINLAGPTTKPAPLAWSPTASPHPGVTASPLRAQSPATAPASLASITLSAAPLVDAKSKIDAGQLLAARQILNAALKSGKLSPADTGNAKLMLNSVNDTVIFSTHRFPNDEFGGSMTVPSGGVLAKIARSHDVTPELLMRMNGITNPRRLRAGQTLKVVSGPFNAIIYKHAFRLEIWLGEPNAKASQYVISFPVGIGKDDSTPTGTWAIENKLKNPAYYPPRGGEIVAADDPKNPLGDYWLGLTGTDGQAVGKESYGIHGTIDPSSIGRQDSMGCIRLTNENIERVFELLVQGKSTVTVVE